MTDSDPLAEPGDKTEPNSRRERVVAWVKDLRSDAEGDDDPGRVRAWVDGVNWWRIAVSLVVTAAVVGIIAGTIYLAGPLSGIVYLFMFLLGFGGVPALILSMGPSMPAFLGSPLGKGHIILAQLAFGHGYLVEFDDEYRLCPGDDDRVYVEGQWHDVAGTAHKTIVGWAPFGVLRYKDDDTLQSARVEPQTATDGGAPDASDIARMGVADVLTNGDGDHNPVTRGGYTEQAPPTNADGWVIDLKRVFSRGLRRFGAIDVIEKAEETAMADEAEQSTFSGMEPLIGSIVGMILGLATAYVAFAAG